jgi:hypothetical protein
MWSVLTRCFKLLLLSPRAIAEPFETDAICAIRDAAASFASISREKESSSALQARFLEKIVIKLSKSTLAQSSNPIPITQGLDQLPPKSDTFRPASIHTADLQPFITPFSDSGSWDDIFASSGFIAGNNLFML